MTDLENNGMTTAAIRNRARRRQARLGPQAAAAGGDTPGVFACCGVGLAFGDATEEDDDATRQFQKEQYEEMKKEKEHHEVELREQYLKKMLARKNGNDVEEAYEVVE